MARFRKRPIEIDAQQLQPDNALTIVRWINSNEGVATMRLPGDPHSGSVYIETTEGRMRADPHDWVIKGVQGEFYPCKPDIFVETYEPVP